MLRPFAAYLRVYEPLSAFGDEPDERFLRAVEAASAGEGGRVGAGERERLMWLKSQFASPPRLLPAELATGRSAPSGVTDVLVLHPSDVPCGKGVSVGPGPLVCPLELRARSATALINFLDEADPVLREVVVGGMPVERVRGHADAAIGDLTNSVMHVLSVTWAIPLPWFTLVDPAQRRFVPGAGLSDPEREVSWRVAMADARRRVALARDLAEETLGDQAPTRMLADTDQWLAAFHPHSAVELDYGGLVQMLDDDALEADTTAEDVHGLLDALRDGDIEELSDLFQSLRDRWSELAARERFN